MTIGRLPIGVKNLVRRAICVCVLIFLAACSGESPVVVAEYPFDGRMVFSPDGTLLAVRVRSNEPGRSYDLAVFDSKSGALRYSWPFDTAELTETVFRPDGKRMVSVARDELCVWSFETRSKERCLPALGAKIDSAFFHRDGRNIVVVPNTGPLAYVFDAETGAEVKRLENTSPAYANARAFRTPQYAHLSRDGRHLVTYSTFFAEVFDTSTWQSIGLVEDRAGQGTITGVELSAGGKVLLVRKLVEAGVWTTAASRKLRRFSSLTAYTNSDLAFDGDRIVTVTRERKVTVWDAANAKAVANVQAGEGVALGAAFAADGKSVVVASEDCGAAEFDAETGELQRTFSSSAGLPFRKVDTVESIALSRDGSKVAVRFGGDHLRIWARK